MCFSLPFQITKIINNNTAEINALGEKRIVKTDLLQELKKGDWILTQADMATQKITSQEASEINELLEQLK